MADIPAYDAHTPVPWNTDSGKVPSDSGREAVAVDWSDDLLSDPQGATRLGMGWESPGTKVSEI